LSGFGVAGRDGARVTSFGAVLNDGTLTTGWPVLLEDLTARTDFRLTAKERFVACAHMMIIARL
jgi:hypothetical protein